jgi:hypothetical protein
MVTLRDNSNKLKSYFSGRRNLAKILRQFFFYFFYFLKTLASLSPARELPLFCSLCCVERVCFAKVLVFFFPPAASFGFLAHFSLQRVERIIFCGRGKKQRTFLFIFLLAMSF